jgi:hypothetical protein
VQGDAVRAAVELGSPDLDQLSKLRVKLNRTTERRHRTIGIVRRGLQIDALILHRITCYSSVQRTRQQAFRRSSLLSAGLKDLDAKSLRGFPQANVVAIQTPEVLAQAHDGCQVQGVE